MDIQINNVGFDIDSKLEAIIQERVSGLAKFYNRIVSSTIYLKLENAGQVKDKIVEISMMVPNQRLICKSEAKLFEIALDDCVSGLERQLKRYKERQSEK